MSPFLFGLLSGLLITHVAWPWWPAVAVVSALGGITAAIFGFRCHGLVWMAAATGCVVTGVAVDQQLSARWPAHKAGEEQVVVVHVGDLPARTGRSVRFVGDIETPDDMRETRLAVTWFAPDHTPRAGEQWRLRLRLHPVAGPRNPGTFNLERWQSGRRVHALATVVDDDTVNRRLGRAQGLPALREFISDRVLLGIPDPEAAAMAVALLVGDRRHIGPDQWTRLIQTGTNHLVAISGLHITLAAGGVWWLASWLLRVASPWTRRVPARIAAAPAGFLAAAAYAGLAGFSVPTQRALIMLAVLMLVLCSRRRLAPMTVLLLAAVAVLVHDPIAPLQAGFWLSFLAVASLIAVAGGRTGAQSTPVGAWCIAQLALFLGLAPMTASLFGHVAPASPLANAIAVPVVGTLGVPLLLLSLPVSVVSVPSAQFLVGWAGWLLQLLNDLLRFVEQAAPAVTLPASPPTATGLIAFLVALAWLRGAGRLALLPMTALLAAMLLWLPPSPRHGEADVLTMDAGYGHATLIRTASHAVLVDTGPTGFSRSLDAVLRAHGVDRPDVLLITRDRSGYHGAGRRLAALRDAVDGARERRCGDADTWSRDGVAFRTWPAGRDGRCLLAVEARKDRLLVATAIETPAHWNDVRGAGARHDMVIVPGHGHRDLLPPPWLRSGVAVIPGDARRRYGLPHDEVLETLTDRGVQVLHSGCHGAVSWRMGADAATVLVARQERGWWNGAQPFGPVGKSDMIPSVC